MSNALELLLIMVAASSPIIIVVFIIQYLKYRTEVKAQLAELRQELDMRSVEDLESDVAQLKERLGVVEAIVTDGKFELLQDFKAIKK